MAQPDIDYGPGWERKQITFWISRQRRQDLMAIALGLPKPATPSDALAFAIDIACARQSTGQLDPAELRDTIDAAVTQGLNDATQAIGTQAQAIEQMDQRLRSIHQFIAKLAAETGAEGVENPAEEVGPLPASAALRFRAWLDRSIAKAGVKPNRSAVVRASWHSVSRISDRFMSVDFNASLVAIDGKATSSALAAQSSTVRFDQLEAPHPFAAADWSALLYLVCQPVGNGWVVQAYRPGPKGAAGVSIGQARI
jgi:hypothetical protein